MVSHAAVKSGLSWQSASLGIQVTLQLVVLALLARLLEPQAFGLVAASYIAIDLCQLLSEAGASAAVIHRQQLDRDFAGTAWSTSIAIGLFLFVVLALVSGPVSSFLAMADLQPVLIALGGVFVLMGTARVPEALLQRELRFSTLMKVNLTSQAFGYALPAIVLALLGFGVWALVAATLLQWTIKASLLCIITRGTYTPSFSSTALREMLAFGLGITKEKIWNYVIVQGDRFIIGRRLGTEVLGQYYVMAVALLPSRYFGDLIDNVFFPVMARMRDDREKLITTWLSLITNCFVFMFGVGIFLAANGEAIVHLAFGERWLATTPVFQVLCLGAGFVMIIRISDALNRALGQVHQTANRKMLNALFFIPTVWIGSSYGLIGACIALVAMQLFNALLQFHLAWQGLDIKARHASTSLYRALMGTVIVLALNGALILAGSYLDMAEWVALGVSAPANLIAGALFFKPLIDLWRQDRKPVAGHDVTDV
ncbi:MAG: lipopolysaccharide biosynthesis protein [Gammaproteobacteria bacterium]